MAQSTPSPAAELNQLIGLALLVGVAAFVLLGFDFLLISQGLAGAVFFAAPYFPLFQAALVRLARFSTQSAHFLPPQGVGVLLRGLQLGLALALIGFGLWDLLGRGFTGQSLWGVLFTR